MATYYLINSVTLASGGTAQVIYPGTRIDSTVTDITPIQNAGGELRASSDAGIAAAATKAQNARTAGASIPELETIMRSALDTSQDTGIGSAATDLASTSLGKGASLVGVHDTGGIITATTVEAALAEIKTLVDAGMQVQKASKQVTSANLVALGALLSGTIDFAAALPANARLVGATVKIATKFQNVGDTNTLTADLGDGTTAAEFLAAANLHQTANEVGGTQTTHPHPLCLNFGAKTPRITFTSSVNFDTYTAGDATFNLFYFVMA